MSKTLVIVGTMNKGGVASVVANQVKACRTYSMEVHFDFACCTPPSEDAQAELRELQSGFYPIRSFSDSPIGYMKDIKAAILASGCDAVHVHLGHLNWVACRIAMKCGVRYRVAHSHGVIPRSVTVPFKAAMVVAPTMNKRYSTTRFACSHPAGQAYFGSDYLFLPNIVDVQSIKSVLSLPQGNYVEEFGVTENPPLLLGFFGALSENKRPEFAIEVSKALNETGVNNILLIAGDGPRRSELERLSGNDGSVVFLGYRDDALALMRFVNAVLLPSVTEGMSLSALESQLLGTPCFASSSIPCTNDLGMSLFKQLSCASPSIWVESICHFKPDEEWLSLEHRIDHLKEISYDERSISAALLNAYGCNL